MTDPKSKRRIQLLGCLAILLSFSIAAAWGQFVESIDAVVNDEIILAGEVDERLAWIEEKYGLDLRDTKTYEQVRNRVLDEMINDILIYQWGIDRGLGLRKDQLKQRVDADIKMRSEHEEIKKEGGLEAALAKVGRSMESYRKSLEESHQREYVISQAIRLAWREVDLPVFRLVGGELDVVQGVGAGILHLE